MRAKPKPFNPKAFVDEVVRPLAHAFERLDVADLVAVRDYLAQLNETNCWWLTYDCRDALRVLVSDEMREREKIAALDAPAGSEARK